MDNEARPWEDRNRGDDDWMYSPDTPLQAARAGKHAAPPAHSTTHIAGIGTASNPQHAPWTARLLVDAAANARAIVQGTRAAVAQVAAAMLADMVPGEPAVLLTVRASCFFIVRWPHSIGFTRAEGYPSVYFRVGSSVLCVWGGVQDAHVAKERVVVSHQLVPPFPR